MAQKTDYPGIDIRRLVNHRIAIFAKFRQLILIVVGANECKVGHLGNCRLSVVDVYSHVKARLFSRGNQRPAVPVDSNNAKRTSWIQCIPTHLITPLVFFKLNPVISQ